MLTPGRSAGPRATPRAGGPSRTPHSGPGTGQINLSKRYQMIGNRLPGFYVDNNFYIAKIPVIENEQS